MCVQTNVKNHSWQLHAHTHPQPHNHKTATLFAPYPPYNPYLSFKKENHLLVP